jgi:hypothetical protein
MCDHSILKGALLMKVLVNITAEALAAIRKHTFPDFKSDATRRADGTWDVPFELSTLKLLQEYTLFGETISDTIIYICSIDLGVD